MRIVVLPGDGIGPEITAATVATLETVDRRFSLGPRCAIASGRPAVEIDCEPRARRGIL